jgi:hypothetical protein
MLELLHDLSGVRLTESTDSRLEFRVTTHVSSAEKTGRRKQAEVEHDLVVDLNSQTSGIEDARVGSYLEQYLSHYIQWKKRIVVMFAHVQRSIFRSLKYQDDRVWGMGTLISWLRLA